MNAEQKRLAALYNNRIMGPGEQQNAMADDERKIREYDQLLSWAKRARSMLEVYYRDLPYEGCQKLLEELT